MERTWNNLGSRSLDEGRSTEALQHLQRGLELNERTGHLSGLAILRHNVSEALLGLGRLDEALVESDTARDLWTSLEAPSASVSWQLRGDVQLARGNATQAAMAYAHAARLAASEDNAQFHAGALAGEAVSLVGTDPARAATLAEEALRISPPVGHAMPVVAAGWVRLSAADADGAAALAERAVELATQHRDLPRLADALELGALARAGADARGDDERVDAQLREAGDIWRDLGNPLRVLANEIVVAHRRRDRLTATVARDELRSLGVHDDIWRVGGPLRAVARPLGADEIRVHVLGQFGVELGGEALPASAWPSRKARDVLRVLACRGDRGIGRERLGALVWPDADAVGNRLSVALSHVRSVLDPGRRLTDSVVVSDGGVVRLDLRHVSVDLVDFTDAARAALAAAKAGSARAVPLLEGAAAMHTGELLEDADGVDGSTGCWPSARRSSSWAARSCTRWPGCWPRGTSPPRRCTGTPACWPTTPTTRRRTARWSLSWSASAGTARRGATTAPTSCAWTSWACRRRAGTSWPAAEPQALRRPATASSSASPTSIRSSHTSRTTSLRGCRRSSRSVAGAPSKTRKDSSDSSRTRGTRFPGWAARCQRLGPSPERSRRHSRLPGASPTTVPGRGSARVTTSGRERGRGHAGSLTRRPFRFLSAQHPVAQARLAATVGAPA